MARYRVQLGYPRQVGSRIQRTELVAAGSARVTDGVLFLTSAGDVVAAYKPGYWTSVRRVS